MLFEVPLNIIWFVAFCFANIAMMISWHFRLKMFYEIDGILLVAGCVYFLYVWAALWSYLAEHEEELSKMSLFQSLLVSAEVIARIPLLTLKTYVASVVIFPLGIIALMSMVIENK